MDAATALEVRRGRSTRRADGPVVPARLGQIPQQDANADRLAGRHRRLHHHYVHTPHQHLAGPPSGPHQIGRPAAPPVGPELSGPSRIALDAATQAQQRQVVDGLRARHSPTPPSDADPRPRLPLIRLKVPPGADPGLHGDASVYDPPGAVLGPSRLIHPRRARASRRRGGVAGSVARCGADAHVRGGARVS